MRRGGNTLHPSVAHAESSPPRSAGWSAARLSRQMRPICSRNRAESPAAAAAITQRMRGVRQRACRSASRTNIRRVVAFFSAQRRRPIRLPHLRQRRVAGDLGFVGEHPAREAGNPVLKHGQILILLLSLGLLAAGGTCRDTAARSPGRRCLFLSLGGHWRHRFGVGHHGEGRRRCRQCALPGQICLGMQRVERDVGLAIVVVAVEVGQHKVQRRRRRRRAGRLGTRPRAERRERRPFLVGAGGSVQGGRGSGPEPSVSISALEKPAAWASCWAWANSGSIRRRSVLSSTGRLERSGQGAGAGAAGGSGAAAGAGARGATAAVSDATNVAACASSPSGCGARRACSRSKMRSSALKTSPQRPQRTQPSETLSWSCTTRNAVLHALATRGQGGSGRRGREAHAARWPDHQDPALLLIRHIQGHPRRVRPLSARRPGAPGCRPSPVARRAPRERPTRGPAA